MGGCLIFILTQRQERQVRRDLTFPTKLRVNLTGAVTMLRVTLTTFVAVCFSGAEHLPEPHSLATTDVETNDSATNKIKFFINIFLYLR
jgi:hypothetical protein